MGTQIKTRFLFVMFAVCLGLNFFFLTNTEAQVSITPVATPDDSTYTFESIEVEGVEFLAVTASSDFDDYAGYTQLADSEKEVAFTIIDGVFTTYDFPNSQKTHFYALGNNGIAAGYYEDSDGLHHGVVLENGELRQYDFPDAVQTEIYGISDTTGDLTGNFIDADGVRRGFSGDLIVEPPGATETFAEFVNSLGVIAGSYIDAEGLYHPYGLLPTGDFVIAEPFITDQPPGTINWEYFFLHGLTDEVVIVARAKVVEDVQRTYVGSLFSGLSEVTLPGSVSTDGWNINSDDSIVGHYESQDGRIHGFIAKPIQDAGHDVEHTELNYTFDSIDVPGVDFLELTASSDFEDYAGNTKSADGEKIVAFTLIDGVFMSYDFPGAKNTYFYALGNNGDAAGHYEDSDGLHHGVILENGELRQYDFPESVETEIYGISDATGDLTGNFIGTDGKRRGFSGETIVEVPDASATYADFVEAQGTIAGSYVDADGIYHPYVLLPNGNFVTLPGTTPNLEYAHYHGINDSGLLVSRYKVMGDVPRTAVGPFGAHQEVTFPGSVSTEGWNINQDSSIVGNYESPDGRKHGFIARPTDKTVSNHFGNAYTVTLSKGLNMLSVPLAQPTPMNARSLAGIAGATTIITLDAETQQFMAWTPSAPNDGFPIEGDKGYIVNVPETRNFAFVGSQWTNQTEAAAAPPAISTQMPKDAWAFVVSGRIGQPTPYEGKSNFDGYHVNIRNLRTNSTLITSVQGDYFAAATADLTRRSVVKVEDLIEVRVLGPEGNVESQTHSFKVTPEHLANAVLSVNLNNIGQPTQNQLLQNYPNPFNPETWIPYQLSEDSSVSIAIYDMTGQLVRTLSLGFQAAGFYNSRHRAAYWDGRNALGERVASSIYFYQLTTPTVQQTRRLVIVK